VPNVSKLYAYVIDPNWLLCAEKKQKKKIKKKLWVHPPSQLIIIELGTGYHKRGVGSETSWHDPEGAAYDYLPTCLAHALLKNYWKVGKLQPRLIPLRNRLLGFMQSWNDTYCLTIVASQLRN
jgi:hypothetical protein